MTGAKPHGRRCRIGGVRDALPLRHIVEDALRHGSAAIAIVRRAIDPACAPTPEESAAIETAARTLRPIGLRLHDYILYYGDHSTSLRLNGRF
ncbi:JAB domain-containing protein [Sphingomonas antarctica]|uniref:JAB domain-containing protein n=1 Tax=Sphingomonas antarctica TaxID=2040274 RepID=UPI0039EB5EEB